MDLGTIIGILAGNALILSAMLMGGTMDMFINIPGLMIVFGGALAACLMAFQLKDVISAFKAAMFPHRLTLQQGAIFTLAAPKQQTAAEPNNPLFFI